MLTPAGAQLFRQAARVHNATVDRWFRQHLDENTAQPIAQTLAHIHEIHQAADQ